MKFKKIVKEGAREEWEDLKAHWTASSKPKMHDQFEYNREWNKAHPELTCDRCGFASRNEDYFDVDGDEVLCDKCRRGMTEESLTSEGLQEDVMEMPDRVDELEKEIEKLWVRLGDVDTETVLELVSKYVELEKLEPGRVDF